MKLHFKLLCQQLFITLGVTVTVKGFNSFPCRSGVWYCAHEHGNDHLIDDHRLP